MTAQPLLFAASVGAVDFTSPADFEAHMKAEHPRGLKFRPELATSYDLHNPGARPGGTVSANLTADSFPKARAPRPAPLVAEEKTWLGQTVHGAPSLLGRVGQVWSLAPRGAAWVVIPNADGTANEAVSAPLAALTLGAPPAAVEAPEEPAEAAPVPPTLADLLAVLDAAEAAA